MEELFSSGLFVLLYKHVNVFNKNRIFINSFIYVDREREPVAHFSKATFSKSFPAGWLWTSDSPGRSHTCHQILPHARIGEEWRWPSLRTFSKYSLWKLEKGPLYANGGRSGIPIGCTHPCNLHLVWTQVASGSACGLEIWVLRAYRLLISRIFLCGQLKAHRNLELGGITELQAKNWENVIPDSNRWFSET